MLLYVTNRPELAVAETEAVVWSTAGVGAAAKLMVCGFAATDSPPPPPPHPDKATAVNTVRETPILILRDIVRVMDIGFLRVHVLG
jgi:hypothetical protein